MTEEKKPAAKTRAQQKPRPQFLLMQIRDENGVPIKIDKDQIEIIACTRNAGEALELMDGGDFENVVYKKVTTES